MIQEFLTRRFLFLDDSFDLWLVEGTGISRMCSNMFLMKAKRSTQKITADVVLVKGPRKANQQEGRDGWS